MLELDLGLDLKLVEVIEVRDRTEICNRRVAI
jgi:hypothetical protein